MVGRLRQQGGGRGKVSGGERIVREKIEKGVTRRDCPKGRLSRGQNEQMEFTRTTMPPKPPTVLLQKVVETMLMSANVSAVGDGWKGGAKAKYLVSVW